MLKLLLTTAAMIAATVQTMISPNNPEPVDTSTVDKSGWQKRGKALTFSWVSKDQHYRQFATPPSGLCTDTIITAWRGERIGIEALVVSRKAMGPVRVELSEFTDNDGKR